MEKKTENEMETAYTGLFKPLKVYPVSISCSISFPSDSSMCKDRASGQASGGKAAFLQGLLLCTYWLLVGTKGM